VARVEVRDMKVKLGESYFLPLYHGRPLRLPELHKPDDPGHGPNLWLTCKVDGKTVTESFPRPAAQRKAEQEIAAFRSYQGL
jgi:hypothetical protein